MSGRFDFYSPRATCSRQSAFRQPAWFHDGDKSRLLLDAAEFRARLALRRELVIRRETRRISAYDIEPRCITRRGRDMLHDD